MSVLVKGMEMPKDCRECPLQAYYGSSGNTLCFPANKYLAEKYNPIGFEGRANWCPLGEVKTPHGDLIDSSEIRWVEHHDSDGNLSKYMVAYSDEMPQYGCLQR